MEEEIKNDLSSIAFSHPFFSDIVGNTLNYIERLEKEIGMLQHKYEKLWYGNIEDIQTVLKVMNEMAEQLVGLSIYDEDKQLVIFKNAEEVKKYFAKKVEKEGC
jgi:hypothetical protein